MTLQRPCRPCTIYCSGILHTATSPRTSSAICESEGKPWFACRDDVTPLARSPFFVAFGRQIGAHPQDDLLSGCKGQVFNGRGWYWPSCYCTEFSLLIIGADLNLLRGVIKVMRRSVCRLFNHCHCNTASLMALVPQSRIIHFDLPSIRVKETGDVDALFITWNFIVIKNCVPMQRYGFVNGHLNDRYSKGPT